MTRSLETRDHSIARQRGVVAVAKLFEHWEDVRRTMSARWNGKEIGDLMPDDMIGADRTELTRFEDSLTSEDRARFRARLSLLVHAVQKDLSNYQSGISDAKAYLHTVEVNRLRGEIDGLKGAVAVLAGTSAAAASLPPSVDIGAPAAAVPPARHPDSQQPWTAFIERFFVDRPSIGQTAQQSHRQAFRDLKVVIGEEQIGSVTKADIKKYADWLRDKVIDRGGHTRLSRTTIVKMLSHIRSLFEWAMTSGVIETNPADGVKPRSETREERDLEDARQAFTSAQLEQLFHSPLYTGCESIHRRNKPGRTIIRDERYWFFLVALFTGARIDELAEAPALLASLDEVKCLDLTEAGTKTSNSPRLIPILPVLVKLGFVEWARTKEGTGKLFQGGAAFGDWSKGSNRYLREIGLTDPTIVTYSLRHNFRQMLNGSGLLGLSQETGDKIFGHGKKKGRSVGANYGRALTAEEARLVVKTVKSPIDLSHLYPLRV